MFEHALLKVSDLSRKAFYRPVLEAPGYREWLDDHTGDCFRRGKRAA